MEGITIKLGLNKLFERVLFLSFFLPKVLICLNIWAGIIEVSFYRLGNSLLGNLVFVVDADSDVFAGKFLID